MKVAVHNGELRGESIVLPETSVTAHVQNRCLRARSKRFQKPLKTLLSEVRADPGKNSEITDPAQDCASAPLHSRTSTDRPCWIECSAAKVSSMLRRAWA